MAALLYRLALRAFPRRHRDLYAAEMLDAFNRQRATHSGLASAVWVIAACVNAITTGLAERRRHKVRRAGYFFSALDFTLAWRLMRRDPGLSLIAVFGMAVGIAVAGAGFSLVARVTDPRLPLPDDERIVSLFNMDVSTSNDEHRLIGDYDRWRSLTSVEDLGLSLARPRNLAVDGGSPEPVTVVEISASAFRVAGVPALRGRHLLAEDEAPGAARAIVIGYDEWVRRFEADPAIVGRSVQLGGVPHAIVGVMPDGFAFPVNHSFWIPWQLDRAAYPPRTGPIVGVFGRLAPGATLDTARAEIAALGQRAAEEFPQTHHHLRPRLGPYTHAFTDMSEPSNALAMRAIQFGMILMLVLVCVNVAILVYARTATRQGEIAIRGALGASRRRIVLQLFVEALTLAGVAAVAGVLMVAVAMPHLESAALAVVGGRLPFWMSFDLNREGLWSIAALTLVSAAIVGVVPAIKATGRDVHARLQTLAPGSGSRMQMGRLWTLLIVGQVALTVAILPVAILILWDGLGLRTGDAGFASREFVTVTLAMDEAPAPPRPDTAAAIAERYGHAHREFEGRLREEPRVLDVTYSLVDPGQELAMALEAEDRPNPSDPVNYNIVEGRKSGHLGRYNKVALNFFSAFDVPVLLGRGFTPADAAAGAVIVSQTTARTVFGDSSPVGRRIKYVGRSRETDGDPLPLERWFEIVGVVPDFPANEIESQLRVYHLAPHGAIYPARVGVRTRAADPASLAGAFRDAAAAVHPLLQVRQLSTPAILIERAQGMSRLLGVTVGMVVLSVLLLSAAGIYALMSFTVSRRRREIGIRAALGANRNRLLAGIFGRVAGQLATGAVAGILGAYGLEAVLEGGLLARRAALVLPLVALIMTMVGLVAAWGPARQGLSIQPTEALREE